jgi:predicted ribosome quality control (RQC) complex YloA/Tae2 family protein
MKELNAYDVSLLVKEAQFLVGGKIDNIYQTDTKDLYLQVYVSGKPKQLLRILGGKCFYLISARPEFPDNQHRLCSFMRKYIVNSRIKSFNQVDNERILQIVVDAKETQYDIFVELFGKGNILISKNKKLIAVAEEQTWADRVIKPGEIYVYPLRPDSKEMFEKQKQKGSDISMQVLDKELGQEILVQKKQNSAKSKEIKKIMNVIEKQSEGLTKAEKDSESNKKKGELIYENYSELKELITKLNSLKGKSIEEIKKSLKSYKLFKDIDKEGNLVVDL